jgi:hypothetical protein
MQRWTPRRQDHFVRSLWQRLAHVLPFSALGDRPWRRMDLPNLYFKWYVFTSHQICIFIALYSFPLPCALPRGWIFPLLNWLLIFSFSLPSSPCFLWCRIRRWWYSQGWKLLHWGYRTCCSELWATVVWLRWTSRCCLPCSPWIRILASCRRRWRHRWSPHCRRSWY